MYMYAEVVAIEYVCSMLDIGCGKKIVVYAVNMWYAVAYKSYYKLRPYIRCIHAFIHLEYIGVNLQQ